MVIKNNHKTLCQKVQRFFASPALFEAEFRAYTEVTLGRNRIETHTLTVSDDLPGQFTGFAGVRQLFRLERRVQRKGTDKATCETVFGMTSVPRLRGSASHLCAVLRGHWTIENRSHYVRDVAFGEDASQVRVGNIPQVMAAFRNMAIGLVRLAGGTNIAAARRHFAAQPKNALKLIGCQMNN